MCANWKPSQEEHPLHQSLQMLSRSRIAPASMAGQAATGSRMRRTLAVAVMLGALFCAAPSYACGSSDHDAFAETALIKEAYSRVPPDDPRKPELETLLPRIDVSIGSLGLNGLYLHDGLRRRALSLLGVERIPNWPVRKADALRERIAAVGDKAAEIQLRAAEEAWSQKQYAVAQKLLDDALEERKIRVLKSRC